MAPSSVKSSVLTDIVQAILVQEIERRFSPLAGVGRYLQLRSNGFDASIGDHFVAEVIQEPQKVVFPHGGDVIKPAFFLEGFVTLFPFVISALRFSLLRFC